jgi:peptidoglycan/LPS O-acetylase OafA/YrhL
MVVFDHFNDLYNGYFKNMAYLGSLGVNVFFVISGFLITTLCIKEKALSGTISLKNFYIRRVFRILPVAYLYVVVITIVNFAFHLHMSLMSFIAAIFFLANISYFRKTQFDWNLAHYWSLSVEEQFYLLFPVLIKKRFKFFVCIVLLIPFAIPFISYLQMVIPILNFELLSSAIRYLNKFQGIAIGCLFSILTFKGYLKFGKFNLVVTIISILMIFYIGYDSTENLHASFFNLIVSIFTGFIVINNVSYKNNLVYEFLNLKVLSWIGILSYSIYIWQQMFLSNDSRFPLSKYPVNLLFIIVVPILSYYFYEQYFLKLKVKFSAAAIAKKMANRND